mmetsp:Transcript_21946/g.42617  ORF Transcript_21946/g.42617 Transcript_21946/m.42617 type:complete len:131 (-) Transcript_21946:1108-1500(-)
MCIRSIPSKACINEPSNVPPALDSLDRDNEILISGFEYGTNAKIFVPQLHESWVLIRYFPMKLDILSATAQKNTPIGASRHAMTLVHSRSHLKMAAMGPFTISQLNPRLASYFPRLMQYTLGVHRAPTTP